MRVMKSQFKLKKEALAFCLFILSIFLAHSVYAYEKATIVHENGFGSGFFIDKNLLVTNYYVVEDAKDRVVSIKAGGGIKDTGKVVVADAKSGLAIIRTLRSDYQVPEMGSEAELKLGDEIFIVVPTDGFSGALDHSQFMIVGRKSAKGTPFPENRFDDGISESVISLEQRYGDYLQITAPISPGVNGSPVFSKDSKAANGDPIEIYKVVGISVSPLDEEQNLNFAIPVSKLRNLMQKNKVALEGVETEKTVEESGNSFDEALASYESKEDKTPQELFDLGRAYNMGDGVARDFKKAFYWYEKAAEQGHAMAQNCLGGMYEYGTGWADVGYDDYGIIAKDSKKAFYWYKKAAGQGHARAQYNLGEIYKKCESVAQDSVSGITYLFPRLAYDDCESIAQDSKKAIYWYEKAAEQGHAGAQLNLGRRYEEGDGIAQDYDKAVYWYKKAADQGHIRGQYEFELLLYKKAADQGHAYAQYNLGKIYEHSYEINSPSGAPREAAYWYEKAAKQGHVEAQYSLGELYADHFKLVQDSKKAAYWYEKAANQGHAMAQYNLGEMYKYGYGVAQDYKKVVYWYEKAAEQGHVEAQYNLGKMYAKGRGVAQDYEEAIYWFEKAAAQGHVEAQLYFGGMYYGGIGVTKDYDKAIYWFEKAAEQGDADAQTVLGGMYYEGIGVTKDYDKAFYWVQKVAEQGNADAQAALGEMYEEGKGIAQDYKQAVYWYKKAADQGHAGAKKALRSIR